MGSIGRLFNHPLLRVWLPLHPRSTLIWSHPQVPSPSIPQGLPPAPVDIVDERIVVRAIKSFPAGTAPGPSGLRASHLKEALSCSSPRASSQFVSTISHLVSMLSSGRVPSTIIPHLYGALLIALKKKSGGLRSIAVGKVLRRLTSKCLLLPLMAEANSILSLAKLVLVSGSAVKLLSTLLTQC